MAGYAVIEPVRHIALRAPRTRVPPGARAVTAGPPRADATVGGATARGATTVGATTTVGAATIRATTTAGVITAVEPSSPIDIVGRSPGDRFDERLERIRDRLAQATFFLFDPESWR
jgi:hypothetical protein